MRLTHKRQVHNDPHLASPGYVYMAMSIAQEFAHLVDELPAGLKYTLLLLSACESCAVLHICHALQRSQWEDGLYLSQALTAKIKMLKTVQLDL